MLPDTPGQIRLQRDPRLVGPETKLADLVVTKGNRSDRHRKISLGPQSLGTLARRAHGGANISQPKGPAGERSQGKKNPGNARERT